MIKGYATKAGTRRYLDAHGIEGIALPDWGADLETCGGLWCSPVGFGGYRITTEVSSHGSALRLALSSGVNLVDTSTNYADGGSESLVGEVLGHLISEKVISRDQVIVVSKVGYLQGQNDAIARNRAEAGRPFPQIVHLDKDLRHCLHPEFIADQLGRSLDRLGLETLDGYLLHNPEYYLEWAEKTGVGIETARAEYARRIQHAFMHLESEVKNGRIRFFGVSSNTLAAPRPSPTFTDFYMLLEAAESMGPEHHFRMIELPLNLLEPGAVIEKNQPDGRSVLSAAHSRGMAVWVNRPLNAFGKNQLMRLADIDDPPRMTEDEIIRNVRAVGKSETRLWRTLLPKTHLPAGIVARIKQQVAIGDALAHYRLNFGSYERWRQVKTGNFIPRIQGVMDFLKTHGQDDPNIGDWIAGHERLLAEAFSAVGSMYADEARQGLGRIRQALSKADPDWGPPILAAETPLSRRAIRAVRSTQGVSSVLVGMRREAYVRDVLEEIRIPCIQKDRTESWMRLSA